MNLALYEHLRHVLQVINPPIFISLTWIRPVDLRMVPVDSLPALSYSNMSPNRPQIYFPEELTLVNLCSNFCYVALYTIFIISTE